MTDASTELFIPDRFEVLRGRPELDAIVTPVEQALSVIDDQFADISDSGFGAMLILRGDSGAGKTTFLDTVPMFRTGVETARVPFGDSIAESLQSLPAANGPRIVIIEGREALGRVSEAEIEEGLHSINAFVRSGAGSSSLVVWPTNKDEISKQIAETADHLGGDALLDTDDPVFHFPGPPKTEWVEIAERTAAALNSGASLLAMGISEDNAQDMLANCGTVGTYLKRVRKQGRKNGRGLAALTVNERCRVWTVVISANDSEGDVAASTRGGLSNADIDRLMTSTTANIVSDLKSEPEKYGLLGTVLDARIVHVDMVTALAVARTYANAKLEGAMKAKGMVVSGDSKAIERLQKSQLGVLLSGATLGTRKRGPKAGPNTVDAMKNLANIASADDVSCNRAFGDAMVAAGLIDSFEVEKDLGTGLKRRTDLYVHRGTERIRIEFMWRTKAGSADIANYVLTKLANYGKAIGYLS